MVPSRSICRQNGVDRAPSITRLIPKVEIQATHFPVPSIQARVASQLVSQGQWQIKGEIWEAARA